MEKFVIIVAVVCVLTLAALPVGCTVNRDIIRTKAIAASTDPIATSCALDSDDSNGHSKAICTLRAAR